MYQTKEGITIITISVFNLKGGTGKTATSKNVAYILATKYGKRVLLNDMDSSGNLSSSFGVRPELSPRDEDGNRELQAMAKLLVLRNADPHDFIVHTHIPGLDIIPSNGSLEDAEKLLRQDDINPQQFRLSRQMRKIQDEYDYCICDCGPHRDLMSINALVCSQEVIVPCNVNADALDAAKRVKDMVEEVADYNPAISIRGALYTRVMNNGVDREGITITPEGMVKFNTYIRNSVEAEKSRFMNMAMREYMREVTHRGFAPMYDYENFVAEYFGEAYPYPSVPYNTQFVEANPDYCFTDEAQD